jgi:hypothetical protein
MLYLKATQWQVPKEPLDFISQIRVGCPSAHGFHFKYSHSIPLFRQDGIVSDGATSRFNLLYININRGEYIYIFYNISIRLQYDTTTMLKCIVCYATRRELSLNDGSVTKGVSNVKVAQHPHESFVFRKIRRA